MHDTLEVDALGIDVHGIDALVTYETENAALRVGHVLTSTGAETEMPALVIHPQPHRPLYDALHRHESPLKRAPVHQQIRPWLPLQKPSFACSFDDDDAFPDLLRQHVHAHATWAAHAAALDRPSCR